MVAIFICPGLIADVLKSSMDPESQTHPCTIASAYQHETSHLPPPSSFQKTTDGFTGTRSISIYRRERASYSTSELNPNAAAQRANTLAQANLRGNISAYLVSLKITF